MVRQDLSEPKQLRLFDRLSGDSFAVAMPIPETTGARRRAARKGKRRVPGNPAKQLSLFEDISEYLA